MLCLNNAGMMTSETIVPGGVGAGGATGIGKTTQEATTAEAEAVAANPAKIIHHGKLVSILRILNLHRHR
ncbi:hypothetical protein SMX63_003740 [Cronobacter universalis]|nr:hypothetical protein [Cronobacter universalis]